MWFWCIRFQRPTTYSLFSGFICFNTTLWDRIRFGTCKMTCAIKKTARYWAPWLLPLMNMGRSKKCFPKSLPSTPILECFFFRKKVWKKFYLWHHESLFLRELKFGRQHNARVSSFIHIEIQFHKESSRWIQTLCYLTHGLLKASPIHDNLNFQINSQH